MNTSDLLCLSICQSPTQFYMSRLIERIGFCPRSGDADKRLERKGAKAEEERKDNASFSGG